jgi:hypothetical protein
MRIEEMSERVMLGIGASRRQALAVLAGAGLGAWQAPVRGSKKTRKAVKRAKKQSKQKCRNQEGQCAQVFTDLCVAGNADPAGAAACTLQFTACCAFLADCQATAFFDCTFTPR